MPPPTDWTRAFGAAVADIRHKWEEFAWGRVVTPRSQTITLESAGEQSPAEKLGWFQRIDQAPSAPHAEHDRDAVEKEKSPERGIDL